MFNDLFLYNFLNVIGMNKSKNKNVLVGKNMYILMILSYY